MQALPRVPRALGALLLLTGFGLASGCSDDDSDSSSGGGGSIDCGDETCAGDETCVYPCCGGAPPPDGGSCTPPPAYCIKTSAVSCPAGDTVNCNDGGGCFGIFQDRTLSCTCA